MKIIKIVIKIITIIKKIQNNSSRSDVELLATFHLLNKLSVLCECCFVLTLIMKEIAENVF